MSSVLMNFMDSKIACRLGIPWEHDRCPPTKPQLPGMEPFTHTIWLSPPPNLATCNDLRLLWRLQEIPLYPQSFPSWVCDSQFQSILLGFCFPLNSSVQEWILLVLVTQSYLTLCDPMDCSSPGSSVCGILQARILESVAIPFLRESSQPRDLTRFPSLQADSLPSEPPRKASYLIQ